MKILILINDAPYGTEKAYNALRLAMALQKDHPSVQVNVFLMADAVGCAIPNQNTPQGYYNIERMLKSVLSKGGKVKACGTCMDARGIQTLQLAEGVEISNMAELSQWTVEADKVLTF
ncbi:MAG: DsrE family protein [Bacteroidota bacterium]